MIDSADFNGDGKTDLIARYTATKRLAVLLNTGFKQNAIRAYVYNDPDRSATRTTGDTPVSGRTINVDKNNNNVLDFGEDSTKSLSNGFWELREPNGTYTIRQLLPFRFEQSTPFSGTGLSNVPADITVSVSGGFVYTVTDFGSYNAGTLRGFVFNDTNGNGLKDTFESG